MALTDKDMMSACANGDGTYDGKKLAQWLFEATTGKPLSDEEADQMIAEARSRAAAKRAGKP